MMRKTMKVLRGAGALAADWDIEEAAKFAGISVPTLYRWRRDEEFMALVESVAQELLDKSGGISKMLESERV